MLDIDFLNIHSQRYALSSTYSFDRFSFLGFANFDTLDILGSKYLY